MAIFVVSTEGPLAFARGKLRPERRDLLSTIGRLSWREGLSAPRGVYPERSRGALRSRRRKSSAAGGDHPAAIKSGLQKLVVGRNPDADHDILEVVVATGARQVLEADLQFPASRRDAGQDLLGVSRIEGRKGME